LISMHFGLYVEYLLIYLIAGVGTAVSLMLGVATQPGSREETAVTVTLPCPDAVPQTAGAVPGPVLDPAVSAAAVARWRAAELLQAVDGPEARERIAERDVIDRALLGQALAGLSPDDAAQVRDACARWTRLRFAVDATAYPRPDAWCSPGREHVHNGACRCQGSSKTAPGWEYQLTAAIGHLRTAWAALADVARTVPATRTAQTIAQVKSVLRRLRAAGHGMKAAPLFIFDAGYSAAALTDGLLGWPVHILVRLAAGCVFYADPVTWDGRYGRPARRGAAVHCLEPE